ncbi:ZIFL1 [Acrasis kona]|uniref:ZIFL1 n=1 Tax=Acrasis kona TaxID=1008807 RepID=A0AAW2YV14_9EUKA
MSVVKMDVELTETEESSENSPLEQHSQVDSLLIHDKNVTAGSRTPLPIGPIISICIMFFSEGFNYTMIFGFVRQMMIHIGIPQARSGYHAGILHMTFSTSQLISGLIYGALTDISQKKHIVISCSLFVTLISNLCFGMISNFSILVICRLISGALNGSLVTAKIYITEVTDGSNALLAYLCFGSAWLVGVAIGPTIGSATAPSNVTPFPFLIPCIIAAVFCLISMVVVLIFMTPKSAEKHDLLWFIKSNQVLYHQISMKENMQSEEMKNVL